MIELLLPHQPEGLVLYRLNNIRLNLALIAFCRELHFLAGTNDLVVLVELFGGSIFVTIDPGLCSMNEVLVPVG